MSDYEALNNPLVLEKVFDYLPPSEVRNSFLVSRYWNHLLSVPKFWSWARLRITRERFDEMIESGILTRISMLEVSCLPSAQLNKLYIWLAEAEDCHVKSLRVSGDLSSLPAVTLSLAVARMEHLTFDRAVASINQLDKIFSLLSQWEKLNLKSLTIEWSDSTTPFLRSLAPDLLTPALLRLEEVNLWGDCLAPHQVRHLLSFIADSEDLRLKRLNLSGNDISSIGPDLLAKSVVRLHEVILINTRLTPLQTDLLLANIVHSLTSPLSGLYLSDNNLSAASPSLLAAGVLCLETVALDDTNLTTLQITSILLQLCQSNNKKVRHIDMDGVDSSLIPEDIMTQVRDKFQLTKGFRVSQKDGKM